MVGIVPQVFLRELADEHLNLLHLVQVVLASKNGHPADELRKDAADGPQVNRFVVWLPAENDLRGSVPPGDNVLGHGLYVLHLSVCVWRLLNAAGEAEITNLQVAVRVDQQIRGLDVPMHHIRRVHEKEAAEQLVHEILVVLVGERLLRHDQAVQVSLHLLSHDVHVLVVRLMGRSQDVHKGNNVLVFKVLCRKW